ncbi:MAG TPA: cereblon family protein [Kofleriaceae bacterium]|nr:cereblon family protein [Kofleriaceae bacterium]
MAKEEARTSSASSTVDDDALRCVVCDHVITSRGARMEMHGSHEHTFVNPAGVVHHIGCFVAAAGCAYVGPTEAAFSWFPGWSWQVAICARCRSHVGWIYRLAGDQFHGLILAALR